MLQRIVLSICLTLGLACATFAQEQVPATQGEITLSFAPVVKRVVPAVVNIYTRHVEKVQVSPLFDDPLFRQFFGAQGGAGGLPRERVVRSLGSGVIIGEDGTIVTSYHVVKGSDEITISLADKREFTGHVEKIDERSDLAVLKVDTKGAKLPALTLRDSDTLEVGDLVLAVGNPFGVGQTVTSGIISALARSAADISDYQFFIQTDAAINPGNSGGALVDMQGRLIGINTAIYSHTGGYQGIGFAIPANMVAAVLKGKTGKSGALIRPWFGVSVQPVTREIADAQGLDVPKGILVQEVAPGSPAEKAGIKLGDIILSMGNSAGSGPIDDAQGLNFRIATAGIGATVEVGVWRAGKELNLPVTLLTQPEGAASAKPVTLGGNSVLQGTEVSNLTPELCEQLGLKAESRGVVVLRGNGAGGFGMSLEAGDVILMMNNKEVHSVAELQKILAVPSRQTQITLLRGGAVYTMTVMH